MARSGFCIALVVIVLAPMSVSAQQLEGFLEPFREISIASPEPGLIHKLHVVEGQRVEADQLLVELDNRLLEASLEIAGARKDAHGSIDAARSTYSGLKKRLDLLTDLVSRGSAREQEVEKARVDTEVAAARLESTLDDQRIASLEYKRIATQIQRRKLHSPVAGVVVEIQKHVGELVITTDPMVMRIAQLDTLRIIARAPINAVSKLEQSASIMVDFPQTGISREANIELLSPVLDPRSGTVDVKLLVDNSDDALRSGQRSVIRLDQ